MMLNAYSVFDQCSMTFGVPFFSINDATARRLFSDLVRDPRSSIYQHPGDYLLYLVGTFVDDTGKIDSIIPQLVSRALEFFQPVKEISNDNPDSFTV